MSLTACLSAPGEATGERTGALDCMNDTGTSPYDRESPPRRHSKCAAPKKSGRQDSCSTVIEDELSRCGHAAPRYTSNGPARCTRVSESDETRSGKTISEWLHVRLPVKQLSYEHLCQKSVPLHKHSWAYNLGGLTLCAFLIQIATGFLLMLYYQPTTAFAHESVHFITTVLPAGSLIRNLHVWSANAM